MSEKVKGVAGGQAEFKPFKSPDGTGDEERENINGTGVAMPQDSEKHLPKAGKID